MIHDAVQLSQVCQALFGLFVMVRDLSNRIFSLRPRLRGQLQKVADCILQNGAHSYFLNTRELAQAAGVSPSTIVRFARRLGYGGFRSFKADLEAKIRGQLSSGERVSETVKALGKREFLRQIIDQDLSLIERTFRLNTEEEFRLIAEAISRADAVYFLGEKSSFALAYFLYFRLCRLSVNCKLVAFGAATIFSELAPLKKGDVLLAIGFREIPAEVCTAVEWVKHKKAKVIAITSPPASAISVKADHVLYVDRGRDERVQSVTAGFTLCHALIIGVAARVGKQSGRVLAEIDALEKSRTGSSS